MFVSFFYCPYKNRLKITLQLKQFFQMAPFKEVKKSMAPSNKTTQKTTFKNTKIPKTFFFSSSTT